MDKKTKMKEKKASGIWKKVLGICLAVIMVIGMTMPAWAQIDAESKGSIKVTADESGWTASAYRVIDVNFGFDNQQPKEPAYVWNKNAAEWVRTNFKDYNEADGNGVTEAFITMDTDKDAVKVKEFADKMSSAIAATCASRLGHAPRSSGNTSSSCASAQLGAETGPLCLARPSSRSHVRFRPG